MQNALSDNVLVYEAEDGRVACEFCHTMGHLRATVGYRSKQPAHQVKWERVPFGVLRRRRVERIVCACGEVGVLYCGPDTVRKHTLGA